MHNVGPYWILQEVHQGICANNYANVKIVEKGCFRIQPFPPISYHQCFFGDRFPNICSINVSSPLLSMNILSSNHLQCFQWSLFGATNFEPRSEPTKRTVIKEITDGGIVKLTKLNGELFSGKFNGSQLKLYTGDPTPGQWLYDVGIVLALQEATRNYGTINYTSQNWEIQRKGDAWRVEVRCQRELCHKVGCHVA